jgi:hypothetical protein
VVRAGGLLLSWGSQLLPVMQPTRAMRARVAKHADLQQSKEPVATVVSTALAAWLRKRNLLHRAHVIAASLEASGALPEEWVEILDGLVSSHSVPPSPTA